MDDPKGTPEEQEKKSEAGAPQPGEKPRKQPRVWVKPGATPPAAPGAPATESGQSEAAKSVPSGEAGQQPAAVPSDKSKKQPKVWVKPGTAPPAPAAAATGQAPAQPPAQKQAPGPAAKVEAPPKKSTKEEAPTYLDISQDPLVLRIKQFFPEAVPAAQSFLNQKILNIDAASILPVCEFLRDDPECEYDMLQDLTAVDYPEREKRFVVVYQLYSLPRNVQVRLKCNIAENEPIASVTSIWSAANWLEREVYDMFGIVFSDHPDLKRILLPEDWIGHPLRKDYDLQKQDEEWIQRHLQIRK